MGAHPQAGKGPGPHSAGVMVVRGAEPAAKAAGEAASPWVVLLLRAYRNWDFPKGRIEDGEEPLAAAIRETAEETTILDLELRFGHAFIDTLPYAGGKVARYFLAVTRVQRIELPVSPELGHAEHHEWRWCSPEEAARLLPARLQPVLAWGRGRLGA